MNLAIETKALAKNYGSVAALQDCSITVPEGSICALVGPNGAGKTTLLHLLAGLCRPTAGEAIVLGRRPAQDPDFLAEVGFLAQEIPMWRRFTAEDHIRVGQHLNRRWDADAARGRISALDIPLDRPVGKLSGGQRAQVALALCLAKQPAVLLLDEPVAALDPVARRHFLSSMVEAVADGGLTVILSSHLVNDLERVCDHLVLLAASRPQLCGDIETIVAEHKVLVGRRRDIGPIERAHTVIEANHTPRQTTLLVKANGPIHDPTWETTDTGLEEIVLAYMGYEAAPPPDAMAAVGGRR
jgi:ABC-2 type transport system ATP-binding protein